MKKSPKESNPYNIQSDNHTCSTTDCTGLIPALPENPSEIEAYEDLYPYLPHPAKAPESEA